MAEYSDLQINNDIEKAVDFGNYHETLEDNLYKIDEVVKETQKAILFRKGKQQFWVPKKLISYHDDEEVSIYHRFDITYIEIVEASADDFDDISEEIIEPDFSEDVKRSLENYPTPFD